MSFVGLHTGLSGLRAAQTGMDTASHNVANANTEGYTRQRVELRTRDPYLSPVGPIGTGVDVSDINRVRDAFLDARFRTLTGSSSYAATSMELHSGLELTLGEPDNGLSGMLDAVWDAFEDLSLDPTDGAARRQVVAALEGLADRVRSVSDGWDTLASTASVEASEVVREVNDLLERVAELNRQIGDARLRGVTPNDLEDQRDQVADRLAELMGAATATDADGSYRIVDRAGNVLVAGTDSLTVDLDATSFAVSADGAAIAGGGELGALTDFLGGALPQRQDELSTLVAEIADAINAQHALGFDADGAPGAPVLAYDPLAGAARTLEVAPTVVADPRLIAAAEEPGAALDGRNAAALAALRTADLGGGSAGAKVSAFTVDIASDVAAAQRDARNGSALALATANARESVHGVSLDEEMVALVQYQRALEASSRVMTAVDQALDVLVNRTGIVGR